MLDPNCGDDLRMYGGRLVDRKDLGFYFSDRSDTAIVPTISLGLEEKVNTEPLVEEKPKGFLDRITRAYISVLFKS